MISPLGREWLEAAKDLGIRVSAPYTLVIASGAAIAFDAAVHDFGSANGMLLMTDWDEHKATAAQAHGYGFSCMDAGAYDRDSTIEVLRDWGWAASVTAPAWL